MVCAALKIEDQWIWYSTKLKDESHVDFDNPSWGNSAAICTRSPSYGCGHMPGSICPKRKNKYHIDQNCFAQNSNLPQKKE